MYNTIDDIKDELKCLCKDYIDILCNLKDEGIISNDTYEECISNKTKFIEQ